MVMAFCPESGASFHARDTLVSAAAISLLAQKNNDSAHVETQSVRDRIAFVFFQQIFYVNKQQIWKKRRASEMASVARVKCNLSFRGPYIERRVSMRFYTSVGVTPDDYSNRKKEKIS